MAEIKSTLDLVMEKTRHLTLSEAERREQQMEEIRKKVRGLLQKYEDGLINREQLGQEWNKIKKSDPSLNSGILVREITARLDPDQDNHLWLGLLTDLCGADISGLTSIFNDYRKSVESLVLKRMKILREKLAAKGISGTAVLPNPKTDDALTADVKAVKSAFKGPISEAISALTRNSPVSG